MRAFRFYWQAREGVKEGPELLEYVARGVGREWPDTELTFKRLTRNRMRI